MTKAELKAKKKALLQKIANSPKGAKMLERIEGQEDGGKSVYLEGVKQVNWLIGKLGAHFEELENKSNDRLAEISGKFAGEVTKIESVLKSIADVNESAAMLQELSAVKSALKSIAAKEVPAPVVNVPAPVVHVQAPEAKIINNPSVVVQESEYQQKAVGTLENLLVVLKKVSDAISSAQTTRILNRKPDEAIPVVLVTKGMRDFYDPSDFPYPMPNGGGGSSSSDAATETTLAEISDATGTITDAEATGNGTIIAILKRLRTLIGGVLNFKSGIGLEVTGTGSAINATPIEATNVSDYRWVSVQFTGTVSLTVVFEGSNNNTNWSLVPLQLLSSTVSVPVTTVPNPTAGSLYAGPIGFKYFRVRVSAYASGTVTANAQFAQSATAINSMGVSASGVTGATSDATAPGTNAPLTIGIIGRQTNRTPVSDGFIARLSGDDHGRLVVIQNQVRDLRADASIVLANAAETIAVAAGGAGVLHEIEWITIANSGAAPIQVILRTVAGGTVKLRARILAGDTKPFTFPGMLKQDTANTAWTVQSSSATGDAEISIGYVKNT